MTDELTATRVRVLSQKRKIENSICVLFVVVCTVLQRVRHGSLGALYEISRIPWFNAPLENGRTARGNGAGAAFGCTVRGTSLVNGALGSPEYAIT